MKSLLFFLVYIALSPCLMISQGLLIFAEDKDRLENKSVSGPICKAFADINGDYRDDIIRYNGKGKLLLELNSNNGMRYRTYEIGSTRSAPYTISVGDLDNDGTNEIITAGYYDGVSVWKMINGTLDFLESVITDTDFFAQASNLVDINNDGWLDLFICNDDGLSKIYLNNGQGGLASAPNLIDMQTEVPSDNSGNYASEWTDVDGDGDLDLYIAKCRLGVVSSEDPRRINVLYINENSNFIEEAETFGVRTGAQSWTGNFGDIDNDGDMDLFVTNHGAPCVLYENLDNKEFRIKPILDTGAALINEAYQSALHDLNNDGWLDIIIGGPNDLILLNNGGTSFSKKESPFGFEDIISFALADANRDGFTDVFGSYNLFGNTGTNPDKLWMNLGNQNHFINICLQGTESNRNGIGARIELFGNWGQQVRQLQSGTGYTITNSLSAHFGTGEWDNADSLVIHWPSGQKDSYTDLQADQFYLAIEGHCCRALPNAEVENTRLDCIQDSILIRVDSMETVDWSDGQKGSELVIRHPRLVDGLLHVTDQCRLPVQSILIDTISLPNRPLLSIEGEPRLCHSSELLVQSRDNMMYSWSDGTVGKGMYISEPGIYFAINNTICDTVYSDTLLIEYLFPDSAIMNLDTQLTNLQDITLHIDRPDVRWYSDIDGNTLLSMGSYFSPATLNGDTSFYFDYQLNQNIPDYILGPTAEDESRLETEYMLPVNLGILFDVGHAIQLNSIQAYALREGPRVIEIFDQKDNKRICRDTIEMVPGLNRIVLEVQLEPGEYLIQTDPFYNMSLYQGPTPLLASLKDVPDFPYEAGDIVRLKTTVIGRQVFPYFFDWRFQTLESACRSGISRYDIKLLSSASAQAVPASFHVYPNPFGGGIQFSEHLNEVDITIYNSQGNTCVFKNNFTGTSIALDDLKPGIYFLQCLKDNKLHTFNLVKH